LVAVAVVVEPLAVVAVLPRRGFAGFREVLLLVLLEAQLVFLGGRKTNRRGRGHTRFCSKKKLKGSGSVKAFFFSSRLYSNARRLAKGAWREECPLAK
jgi:hypothetical protein